MRDLLADAVVVEYRGSVTVGGAGRGRLHGRPGGIGEMLWEALGRAGWIGERVRIRTTVSPRLAVAAAPASRPEHRSRLEPLPGGVRRLGERGWVDDDGVQWQQFVGPLNGRAAGPGYRLLESERSPEELEFGEDMLYTAAVHAGWLRDEPGWVSDIPDARITVAVARRNPSWENPVEPAAISPHPDVVPVSAVRSADERQSQRAAQTSAAIDERQLLALALEVAARKGRSGAGADPACPPQPLRGYSHHRFSRVQRRLVLHRGDGGQFPGAQATPAGSESTTRRTTLLIPVPDPCGRHRDRPDHRQRLVESMSRPFIVGGRRDGS